MNAENFATWLRRQGYHVYRSASSYWYDAGPRVLQAFPYHWLITPTQRELDALMWKHGAIALRVFGAAVPAQGEGQLSRHPAQAL